MERSKFQLIVLSIVILISPRDLLSQQKHKTFICKPDVFASLQPLPDFNYECPPNITSESDDRILKSPERMKSIINVLKELKSLNSLEWWNSHVDDLNVCYFRDKPGGLNVEETEQFTDQEYQVNLLGNDQIRLVLIPDPCYQSYYNGTNVFLLYRNGGKVHVTEVIDGYFSRVANSISMSVLRLNGRPLIKIRTMNILGMQPTTSNYYYVIDEATKKAIPTKLPGRRRR